MGGYYAYILDEDDHFIGRVNVVCDGDEEAKRLAKQLVDHRAVELWQQDRKVARFEPTHSNPVSHVIKDGRMVPKNE